MSTKQVINAMQGWQHNHSSSPGTLKSYCHFVRNTDRHVFVPLFISQTSKEKMLHVSSLMAISSLWQQNKQRTRRQGAGLTVYIML